jgi:hypothetical protein
MNRMLTHTCDISRKVAVGTNGRMQNQILHTSVRSFFVPMTAPVNIEMGFTLGRDHNVYFEPDQDVQVGDQLLWRGKKFNLRTVSLFDIPRVGHKKCLATEEV